MSAVGHSCHLQCLQEVTVEERKERRRAAPTIDMMEERKGGRKHLNVDITVDTVAHYYVFEENNNMWLLTKNN